MVHKYFKLIEKKRKITIVLNSGVLINIDKTIIRG